LNYTTESKKPPARKPLRIAQVAPLYESVPPRLMAAPNAWLSYLTEELVRQGIT